MPATRKDAEALENERGRLWVTSKLILALESAIEDATDDLRLLKTEDEIGRKLLNDKLVTVGAVAEALSERACGSLNAIDTIIDSLNRE